MTQDTKLFEPVDILMQECAQRMLNCIRGPALPGTGKGLKLQQIAESFSTEERRLELVDSLRQQIEQISQLEWTVRMVDPTLVQWSNLHAPYRVIVAVCPYGSVPEGQTLSQMLPEMCLFCLAPAEHWLIVTAPRLRSRQQQSTTTSEA